MFAASTTSEPDLVYQPVGYAHPHAAPQQGSPAATYAHSAAYSRRSSFSAVSSPAMSAHESLEVPTSLAARPSKSNHHGPSSSKQRRNNNASGHRDEWQRMRYFSRSAASSGSADPSTPKTTASPPPAPSFLRPSVETSPLAVAKSSPPKLVSPLAEWALGGRASV